MPKLLVIIASTRPGRVGLPVANWFIQHASASGEWQVMVADLAELDLPMLDEPMHPRLKQYGHEHTKRWSSTVDVADCYVVVMPEYNFSIPAPLVNALDYVYSEWNYKPFGFVSYGGVSGGLRAVQMAKQLVTTLKMMPMFEAVTIPFVQKFISDQGEFVPSEMHTQSADDLLTELKKWSDALSTIRQVQYTLGGN